jgi:hypothetical protein
MVRPKGKRLKMCLTGGGFSAFQNGCGSIFFMTGKYTGSQKKYSAISG